MAETRDILGFNVTYAETPEATEQYLERFRNEFLELGFAAVITHASDLLALMPSTWHNYVDMRSGDPVIHQVNDGAVKTLDVQLRLAELSGAQLDPSIVKGPEPMIRINVNTRGCVVCFNYYPGQRMIVGPDIFHSFNTGGISVVASDIDAIKSLKIQSSSNTDSVVPLDKAVVVMGGKVYNLDLVGFGDLDSHYKERVVKVKMNAQSFERRILGNYQAALGELRMQRDRLMRDLLSMPILSYELVSRGIGLSRYMHAGDRADGTFCVTKDVKFTVAKVFKIGGGMPVRIPDELRLNIDGRMFIRCKPADGGKYQPCGVELFAKSEAAEAAGVLVGVTHPHVMEGGSVCIGDYHLPPYIEFNDHNDTNWAHNVFADLCKTLSTLNPQSWYQSSANRTAALVNWIYEHIPESNPNRH